MSIGELQAVIARQEKIIAEQAHEITVITLRCGSIMKELTLKGA